MATMDSRIVNIALPTLTKELGTDLNQIKWTVIIYLLVITCTLLPFGRLSDIYGRKKVFQFGFFIFTLGSTLCGFSSTLSGLILFRAIQAVGASMLMANGPAIITSTFPASERGAALGTMAMVVSGGLISGPSVGGVLITQLGWQSIFWVNLPIGLIGLLLVFKKVVKDPRPAEREPFDWVGAFLQTAFLLSFIVLFDPPVVSVSGSQNFPIPTWLVAIITAIIGAVFIKVESEAKAPLLDLSLLKNRTFWTAILASFMTFVAFSSVSVLMPFFLEEILHLPPHKAGIFMTAIPFAIFIVAPISGRLSDRLGSHGLSFSGAMIGCITLFVMAGAFGLGLHENTTHFGIILVLAAVGISIGMFQSPNNNAIMGAVPIQKLGVASALLATVRNLGMVSGTGMATGLFTYQFSKTGNFVGSMHFALYAAALTGIGASIASLGKQRGPERRKVER